MVTRALVLFSLFLLEACSSATTNCAPKQPAEACTAEVAGLEFCTAPVSGSYFVCGDGCWSARNDGPCFPPTTEDGGVVSCPSGATWKGAACPGVDAGTRSCFGKTQAECARGCWYPVGVCRN